MQPKVLRVTGVMSRGSIRQKEGKAEAGVAGAGAGTESKLVMSCDSGSEVTETLSPVPPGRR